MQSPALRIAHEMGLWTAVLDGNPEAQFRSLADRFEVIDLKDKEGILDFASKLKSEEAGLSGIMTAGTDFSPSVAYTAEKLGLPGIHYETALNAQDKARMRACFDNAGVPSPRWTVLDAASACGFLPKFDFPVVVKPVDNMGARGCRMAGNAPELDEAVRDALRFSRSGRAIVEEYMEGPEFSIDALVDKGKITICGLAERHIFFPPYFVEMGHTMPAGLSKKDEDAILDVFCAGVKALGIDNGAAKGDIKLTPRHSEHAAMVGEIAARLSGGYMSGWTYPYASGAEPTRGALCIAIGLEPEGIIPTRNWVSAERAFIAEKSGIVSAIHGMEDAAKVPFVKDVFLRIKPGDAVEPPKNNVSKCGNVISAAPTRKEAVNSACEAVSKIKIEITEPLAKREPLVRG